MMIASAPSLVPQAEAAEVDAIARFVAQASFETTKPSDAELAALKDAAAPGARIYVSAIPSRPLAEQINVVKRVRACGFEPVPHVAARNFATRDELDHYLRQVVEEANVKRLLVIGGDRDEPAGIFHHAIDVIDIGLIQSHGIREIGIAGYPDGHPRIAAAEMDRALAAKIEAAEQTGLTVHIVTQFSFDPAAILAWIGRVRDMGLDQAIAVGVAGPASLATLLRYASICGVQRSARALTRNAGLAKHLLGATTPDTVIRPLATAWAHGKLGTIFPHFFSFGGLGKAARWAAAVAAGHIALDPLGGFTVEPR